MLHLTSFLTEDESSPIPSEVWRLISEETVEDDQGASMDTDTLVSVSHSISDSVNSFNVDQSGVRHVQPIPSQVNHTAAARNVFRTLSRNSSASSLASVSDLGRDSREREPLKLPEIDPTGSLVSQGYGSQRRNGSANSVRTPVNFVRSSQSDSRVDSQNTYVGGGDSRLELMSLDGELMSPHPPPSGDKREGSANNKSRTTTPASRLSAS